MNPQKPPDKKKRPLIRRRQKPIVNIWPLEQFPYELLQGIGSEIVYMLATRDKPKLSGKEWEQIFAKAIGGNVIPGSVGLNDVYLGRYVWSTKTVEHSKPWRQSKVRLISGRNNILHSYGHSVNPKTDPPDKIGDMVLGIWNSRFKEVQKDYDDMRCIVLLRSSDLLQLTLFEYRPQTYDAAKYKWLWNKNNNLEGYQNGQHCFTWQEGGSQFTIIKKVSDNKTCLRIKQPTLRYVVDAVLEAIGFDETWVKVIDPKSEGY